MTCGLQYTHHCNGCAGAFFKAMNDKAQNLGRCFETLVAQMRDCNLWSSCNHTDKAVLKKLMNQVWLFDAASNLEHVNGQRKVQRGWTCCSFSFMKECQL